MSRWIYQNLELPFRNFINKNKAENHFLCGISLLDNDHLFIAGENGFELVNINKDLKIRKYFCHKKDVVTIKIINHPKYEKCLIFQGCGKDSIIMWIKK